MADDESHEIEVDDCYGTEKCHSDRHEHLLEREICTLDDGLRCHASHDDYPQHVEPPKVEVEHIFEVEADEE